MLKNIKEISKDSFLYGGTTVLSQVLSLVLVPFFSRELSPEEYGVLGMVALVMSFLEPIVGMGMDSALFRYFTRSNDPFTKPQYFTIAFLSKGIIIIISTLLLIPSFSFINDMIFSNQLTYNSFLAMVLTFLVKNTTSIGYVALRADRKVLLVSIANFSSLLVGLTFSICLVLFLKMGVYGALLATLIGTSVKSIFFLYTIKSNFDFPKNFLNKMKELFKYGLPQVPHKIQAKIISLLTLFVINQYMGLAVAGLYAVATKFAKPINLVVSTVQTAWSPYKFQLHREEDNPVLLFEKIIPLYWIVLITLWSVLSLITPWLFRLLIDDRYHTAIPMLPFLMILPVLEGFRFTVSTGFELSDQQYKSIFASFLALCTFMILVFLTLDFYPPYAFILSQGISYAVMGVVLLREARKVMYIHYPFKEIILFCAICIIIVIFTYQNYTIITLSIVAFLLTLLTLGIVQRLYSLSRIYSELKNRFFQYKLRSKP